MLVSSLCLRVIDQHSILTGCLAGGYNAAG
jgi:hypothetical protein